jgi:hypothetical protein
MRKTTTITNHKVVDMIAYIKRHVKPLASSFQRMPEGGKYRDYRFFLDGVAKGAFRIKYRNEMYREDRLSRRLHGRKIPSRSRRFERMAELSQWTIRRAAWRLYKNLKRSKSIGPGEVIVFDKTDFELPESYPGGYWYWKKVKGVEKYLYGIEAVCVGVVAPSGDVLILAVEMINHGEGELPAAKRALTWLEQMQRENRWLLPSIVCDRGYIDGTFIQRADAISSGFVGKPKCNQDFLSDGLGILEMVSEDPKTAGQYDKGTIRFKRKTTGAKTCHLLEVGDLVSWEALGLKLRLVVSQNGRDFDDEEYFFTTAHRFAIPTEMVFRGYKQRWHIEPWFQQLKSFFGNYPDSWDAGTFVIGFHLQCLGYFMFKLYLKFRRVDPDTCILYKEAEIFLEEVKYCCRNYPGYRKSRPP